EIGQWWEVRRVLFGAVAQGGGFELSDPLLGHSEPAAQLFERLRLRLGIEPEAVQDDVPFSFVEATEDPHDRLVLPVIDELLLEQIGRASCRGGAKQVR